MDVLKVKEAVLSAVKAARSDKGPTLIECKTYRHLGHSKSDQREYRTKKEEELWLKKDPINKFRSKILRNKILTKMQIDNIHKKILIEIENAVKFAVASKPLPARKLLNDLYN